MHFISRYEYFIGHFLLDFDDDNDITKYDLMDVIDRLTWGSQLLMEEKVHICDIVSKNDSNCNTNKYVNWSMHST